MLPMRVRDPYPGGVVALISGQKKKGYPDHGFEELCVRSWEAIHSIDGFYL